MELIERPAPDALHPVLVIADKGFIFAGLAERDKLVSAIRSGRTVGTISLWDSRTILRYAGAGGSLGGLATYGPQEVLGDQWQRMDAAASGVRHSSVVAWVSMTDAAWEAVKAWPIYGA